MSSIQSDLRKALADIEMLKNERELLKEGYERDISTIRRELQDAKILVYDRVKELVGIGTSHSKADKLPLSGVRGRVTNLNEEILQGAASFGKTLVHRSHRMSEEEMNFAAATVQDLVGRRICDVLISESHKDKDEINPLIVQVVLQVFLTNYCRSVIQSWVPGDPTSTKVLFSLYKKIDEKEDQAAAGQWRSITRKYSRPAIDDWKRDFLIKLNCVLRIARWDTSHGQKDEEFEKRFTPIFNAVQSVRIAVGEDFTSADLGVFVVPEDVPFDDKYMEDAYEDPDAKRNGGHNSSEIVVGTTAVGLKSGMRQQNEKGGRVYECLLPAKVVLESTLQEALAPRNRDGRG